MATSHEKLAGEYRFESVVPEPVDGPFPPQATSKMAITLGRRGGMSVQSLINSGHGGSYVLGSADDGGATITFSGGMWTEMGLGRVAGDDANGTLRRRMYEAEEFLRRRLSGSEGAYRVTIGRRGGKRVLVLDNLNSGAKITFVEDA